ncbi:DUF3908 family protein [Candidatus Clostridium radicumherbarum]|uniref:DUF3908 family protein n=1 Tax=Candidatus Clostridium radicumherbarum TaxID=3381662 RepID=A0ABW8TYN9_9CLOT
MLNYNEMKNYFHGRFYCNTKEAIVSKIINRAEEIVGEKDIKLFYPQNIFVEEKGFKFYVFYNNRILKVSENDNFIFTNFYNLGNIDKFILKENSKDESEKMLEIKFKDNEILIFNSYEDTNEYYKKDLASIIEEICKNIVSCKESKIISKEV